MLVSLFFGIEMEIDVINVTMKNIFMSLLLLAGINSFAQEAGKAGELLKNEVSTIEKQTPGNAEKRNRNSDFSRSDKGNPQNSTKKNPNYNWNQNYGYAEVFVRIPEQGFFTVEVDDQAISNASGKFRFFDLQAGKIPISVYDNGYLIYKTTLRLRNNNRMVLDFFTDKGLYLLDSYPVQNQSYGFNDWNDIWNNPYGNQPGNGYPSGNVMDNNTFMQFFQMLQKNEKFDDGKITMIRQQTNTTSFTSQQIRDLVKSLSFDKNRLMLAKLLYRQSADKNKYFLVYDAFDFDGSKRELMEFITQS